MIAGTLKEIVSFLAPTTIKDGFGSTNITYSKVCTTRASVRYSSGSREVSNNEILNSYNYIFTVRSYHNINEKMLIEWKGKQYRILSIDNTETSKLTITTELVNE